MEFELKTGEKKEPLGKNMSIIVSRAHTFGTDAILLSDFANPKKKETLCDLGTGCGIIPLLWCKKETGNITAVDIQPAACDQLTRSLALNGLENRVNVVNADLRQLKGVLSFGAFDLVTMNPPYKPLGTGIESESEADKIARHETMCTVDDAVKAAASLLRFGGRFCMCHRPERLCDIICSMRENKLEVKRLRFVCQHEGEPAWLVLVEGKRGAKSSVRIEKNLIMQNADNTDSEEIQRIFFDYRQSRGT